MAGSFIPSEATQAANAKIDHLTTTETHLKAADLLTHPQNRGRQTLAMEDGHLRGFRLMCVGLKKRFSKAALPLKYLRTQLKDKGISRLTELWRNRA